MFTVWIIFKQCISSRKALETLYILQVISWIVFCLSKTCCCFDWFHEHSYHCRTRTHECLQSHRIKSIIKRSIAFILFVSLFSDFICERTMRWYTLKQQCKTENHYYSAESLHQQLQLRVKWNVVKQLNRKLSCNRGIFLSFIELQFLLRNCTYLLQNCKI